MPTSVSLAQMVDLSLGTPEIGSVNFNVMHTLLHAIIKKLNIGDIRTEINEHDRDFLATSKIRARSTLSDADSGRGEESEDGLSEKSVPPFKPTPYHRLELKVEKLFEQMEALNKLPTNTELFDRTTKAKGEAADRPIADMWQYMQMKKRVDANEEGVGKVICTNRSSIYTTFYIQIHSGHAHHRDLLEHKSDAHPQVLKQVVLYILLSPTSELEGS